MIRATTATTLLLLGAVIMSSMAFAEEPAGVSNFEFKLPPPVAPKELLVDSPFGINNALSPSSGDLDERLEGFQSAGIKWGRQDFTWRVIETAPGVYDWSGYDKLVDKCLASGQMIFGNFAYGPKFHDPRTPEGVKAYAAFAAAAAKRYAGKVDYWQIWNEPNGGFWDGTPEQYAALLAASGKAIHEANPKAKVLALNMAFCDVIWAERILKLVPYDCFDIACFHPYRPPTAPEEKLDMWILDHYVKSWHPELDEDYPLVTMTFMEQTAELVKVMRKFGEPKPMWITEICWNSHLHPYGVSELRQADLLVRFYTIAIALPRVEKVFWWTFKDGGRNRQFDQGDMVGIVRPDYQPKYAFYAYSMMSRMLEGKKLVRADSYGPEVYAFVFRDEKTDMDTIVAWTTKSVGYVNVNNTEKGVTIYDIFGTKRFVPLDEIRTAKFTIPVTESPIYIVAPKGLKAVVRPMPGW